MGESISNNPDTSNSRTSSPQAERQEASVPTPQSSLISPYIRVGLEVGTRRPFSAYDDAFIFESTQARKWGFSATAGVAAMRGRWGLHVGGTGWLIFSPDDYVYHGTYEGLIIRTEPGNMLGIVPGFGGELGVMFYISNGATIGSLLGISTPLSPVKTNYVLNYEEELEGATQFGGPYAVQNPLGAYSLFAGPKLCVKSVCATVGPEFRPQGTDANERLIGFRMGISGEFSPRGTKGPLIIKAKGGEDAVRGEKSESASVHEVVPGLSIPADAKHLHKEVRAAASRTQAIAMRAMRQLRRAEGRHFHFLDEDAKTQLIYPLMREINKANDIAQVAAENAQSSYILLLIAPDQGSVDRLYRHLQDETEKVRKALIKVQEAMEKLEPQLSRSAERKREAEARDRKDQEGRITALANKDPQTAVMAQAQTIQDIQALYTRIGPLTLDMVKVDMEDLSEDDIARLFTDEGVINGNALVTRGALATIPVGTIIDEVAQLYAELRVHERYFEQQAQTSEIYQQALSDWKAFSKPQLQALGARKLKQVPHKVIAPLDAKLKPLHKSEVELKKMSVAELADLKKGLEEIQTSLEGYREALKSLAAEGQRLKLEADRNYSE